MKKILTVICCSVCCGFAAAQGTYSLEQLKQLAVENNYNLLLMLLRLLDGITGRAEVIIVFYGQLLQLVEGIGLLGCDRTAACQTHYKGIYLFHLFTILYSLFTITFSSLLPITFQ